jgi:uncharacterized protein YfaS (alpha-2-macroglobulin family)
MYLMAWNELDPTSPNAVATAAELLRAIQSSSYLTTHETGFATMSLANFYSYHKADGIADLSLLDGNSEEIAVVSGDASVVQKIGPDTSYLTVKNSGDGAGYATWTVDGVPISRPPASDSGLRAYVEYRDVNGSSLPANLVLNRGDRITGTVYITPLAASARDIVVALPFAGGLEIENPRLMDTTVSEAQSYESQSYASSRVELRDDRLLLFIDEIGKTFTWKFTMRAVTAGTFTLPPISAEGMYSPGMRSLGETFQITVK